MRYKLLTILLFVSFWSSGQNFYWSHNIGAPVVITHNVGLYTADEATWFWEVLRTGGDAFTESGILISTSINPVKDSTTVAMEFGKGMFSNFFTNLHPQTTYYVRAWASNQYGTVYGENIYFTTPGYPSGVPIVQTKQASEITSNSAKSGGIITHVGGSNITQKGVIWRLTPGVTWANKSDFTNNGAGTAEYTSNMTELLYDTTYYYRAYALNSSGYGYGDEFKFKALSTGSVPTVISSAGGIVIGNYISLFLRGEVTETWGLPILQVGFYLSTIEGILGEYHVLSSFIDWYFTEWMEELRPVTTYYITAYADNIEGRGYGNQVKFNPTPTTNIPKVTPYFSKITWRLGGTITDDGGLSIIDRAICISKDTTQTPSLFDCFSGIIVNGSSFYVSAQGWSMLQYYYGRASATNSAGIGHSKWILTCSDTGFYEGREYSTWWWGTHGVTTNRYNFSVDPRNGYSYRLRLSRFTWAVSVFGSDYNYINAAPVMTYVYKRTFLTDSLIVASRWIGGKRYDYGGGQRSDFTSKLNGKPDAGRIGYTFPHYGEGTAPDGYPYVLDQEWIDINIPTIGGVDNIWVKIASPLKNPAAFAQKTYRFRIFCNGV